MACIRAAVEQIEWRDSRHILEGETIGYANRLLFRGERKEIKGNSSL